MPLKVASLVIAVVLAYAVHSPGNVSVVTLVVPIEFRNAPEEKVIVKPSKKDVQVTLKGPSFLVGPVASSPPSLRAHLPDSREDRVSVVFKSSDLSLPDSVEVLSIEPAQMEFVFEPVEKREVRVEVPRLGQLPNEFLLDGIDVAPKMIVVKGPRSEVRQLRAIEAEPVNLNELTATSEIVLNLRSPASAVSLGTKSVLARISVSQVPSEKRFARLPVEIRAPRGLGKFTIVPSEVSVTLSAPPVLLSKLEPSEAIPYVRIFDLPFDRTEEVKVMVDVPPGIKVMQVEPASVVIQQGAALGARRETKKIKK